jgi:hypothetical protein
MTVPSRPHRPFFLYVLLFSLHLLIPHLGRFLFRLVVLFRYAWERIECGQIGTGEPGGGL